MTMRWKSFFFLASMISFNSAVASERRICTVPEEIAAETESSTLGSWTALYRAFDQFKHCDDGAIAEGYSETVSRLLAEDWKNLGRLRILVDRNRGFEHFVFRHIDGTWHLERLIKVEANAKYRCSKKNQPLCKKILSEVLSARRPSVSE